MDNLRTTYGQLLTSLVISFYCKKNNKKVHGRMCNCATFATANEHNYPHFFALRAQKCLPDLHAALPYSAKKFNQHRQKTFQRTLDFLGKK